MADGKPPYWVLISVLFSSFPLAEGVALLLHEAALELVRSGRKETPVAGDVLSGKVRDMDHHAVLGAIRGPAFEAELETERGSGTVRFILTREGLELLKARAGPPGAPRYLN
ncbi:MAG: hypothetical protein FJ086_09135 [Deltaproteobacteria bacterium]|nr:hypothetical protein [Deltaproteobacteria bacterium]